MNSPLNSFYPLIVHDIVTIIIVCFSGLPSRVTESMYTAHVVTGMCHAHT